MTAPTVHIQIIGHIWMPNTTAAMEYTAPLKRGNEDTFAKDLHWPADEDFRESVEQWLATNSGDFQSVDDFAAWVSLPTEPCECCKRMQFRTVETPWQDEESELTFNDCIYGSEDD